MKSDNPDKSFLVDGKYTIEDLVDLNQLRQLFEQFTQATGFTIGFLDHPGLNILIGTGWRDICTKYHRMCALGQANCDKSNRHLLDQLDEPDKLVIEACENGLVDCATPIIIHGKHIASLATGQLLLQEPDLERFKHQARLFGFDEAEYLKALAEIPVVDEEKLKAVTAFLGEMALVISQMGYNRLLIQKETEQMAIEIAERKRAEEALRQSEERFRVAQELSLYAFTIMSPVRNSTGIIVDFRWDYVNPEAGRILKHTPEDLVGQKLLEILPGNKTNSDLFERYVRVVETGESHDYEVCYASEGVHGWFRNMTVKLGDGIAVSFTDITKRKLAEEALRESEERFRGLAESMTQMVWIADAQGVSIYHNPRVVEYTGLTESTAEERWQLIHPEDLSLVQEKWLEHLPSGTNFQVPYRIRGKDGSYRWFLGRSTIMRDADQQPVRLFATASDIDDLIRTEAALKESVAILAEAERIGLTGSWKRDLVTNQIIWSSGTHRIFGIPENEGISFETFKSLIHPEDRDSLLGKLEETAQKGTPMAAEFRILLPDGTIRALSSKGEATCDSGGKPILIHGTVQDITERKKLEDDLIKVQRLESIGTLAGGIAHDYNNILTGILGYVDLAKMKVANTDEAYTLLTKAEQSVETARNLTQQIITFSKGGYPRSKLMHIRDLITQSVRLALSGSNTGAEWKIADDLPEVKVDENQIRQVIHNIVINAQEAMPQGGKLFIEVDKVFLGPDNPLSLAEGIYVRMVFRDEGSGISADNLPRIFDPYFTTKDIGSTKGMGLGLSICYSIIKRHGGRIVLDSKEGIGTTVTIHIPAAIMHN